MTAMPDTYERDCRLTLTAPASMLESVAGLTVSDVHREFVFAVGAASYNDPAALRWLAVILERRIADIEAGL